MSLHRTVILDTESTGFSPKSGDRLIEIAAIELIEGRATGRELYGLFWPERAVPHQAAAVHGWTTEKLRGKPLFASQASTIADFLDGATIWAHNAAFDARFVHAELERAGISRTYNFSCSLKLAKKMLPHTRSHKLADLARWAGHAWTGAAHTAMADTYALASVLDKLSAMEPPMPARAPKPAPAPRTKPADTTALPAWSGPVAPGNDPRVAHITCALPLFAQGTSWTGAEDLRLRSAFVEGADLAELVAAHGRSPAALALRLERQGLVAGDHPYANLRRRG